MWKLLVFTAFLSLESSGRGVFALQDHGTVPSAVTTQASMPYQFSYNADASEGSHSRHEQRDENGRVTGHYTIMTDEGQQRVVCYVADENGFRAWVDTNEQGTANEDPSSVSIRSSAFGTGDAPRQPIKGICGRPPTTTQTTIPAPAPLPAPPVVTPPVRKPSYVPTQEVIVHPPPVKETVIHTPPPTKVVISHPPPPPQTVIVPQPPRVVLPPPRKTEYVPTAQVTVVEPQRPPVRVTYPPPPPVVKTVYVPPQQVIVQEAPKPKTPFRKVAYGPDDQPSPVPEPPTNEVYYPSPSPPRPTVAPPTFVPSQDTYGPPNTRVYAPPIRTVTYVPVVRKVVAKVTPGGGDVPQGGHAVRKVYGPHQVTRFEPNPQVTYHTRRVSSSSYGSPAYDVPIGTSYKMTVSRTPSYNQPSQIYEYVSPTTYTYGGRPSSSYRTPCTSCGSGTPGYENPSPSYSSPRRRTRPSSYSRSADASDVYEFAQPTYG